MKILSNPYNASNDRAIFERVVILAIILIALQFISEFFTTVITTGYFILPIIYVLVKYDRTKVNVLKKSILHLVVTLGISLFAFSKHEILYESLNLVYLVSYVLAIYRNLKNPIANTVGFEIYNFIGLYCFYIIAGSGACFFYLVLDLLGDNYEVSSKFLLGGFDFFAIVFSSLTLIISRKNGRQAKAIEQNKRESKGVSGVVESLSISTEQCETIIKYFEKSEAYLETSFSLEQLANDLNLSKQQVSEVINQDMNSSFYQLLAMYRIDHAKVLIEENKNLTIEAIVDECGFSSKSTFNKYFKYYVGQTPSVYRSELV
ncbi:helix-turn-helix domain-containing protein [Myroides sp. N17-2]|uniref:helix-turn-helix domain-containing protein n=1 Tax=Myroides sp. N17-2 TaxID=2030799 RepID=UPI000EFB2BBE|nr:helix-turn-helix domain-containing protein [Myroides sp. N17-2]